MHERGHRIGAGRAEVAPAAEAGVTGLTAPDDAVRQRFEQLICEEDPEPRGSAEPGETGEAASVNSQGGSHARRDEKGEDSATLPPLLLTSPLPPANVPPRVPEQEALPVRNPRMSVSRDERLEVRVLAGAPGHGAGMPVDAAMVVNWQPDPACRSQAASLTADADLDATAPAPTPAPEASPADREFPSGVPARASSETHPPERPQGTQVRLKPAPEMPSRSERSPEGLIAQSPRTTHQAGSASVFTSPSSVDLRAPTPGATSIPSERNDLDPEGSEPLTAADSLSLPVSPPVTTPSLREPAPVAVEKTLSLPPGALSDWLQETVSDLKVYKGDAGMSQVRLDIKPEFLPGVRVILQEAGGRIQVDFICLAESSRRLLGSVARREATEMARRCGRDLLLRVHSDEDDQDARAGTSSDAIEIVAAA